AIEGKDNHGQQHQIEFARPGCRRIGAGERRCRISPAQPFHGLRADGDRRASVRQNWEGSQNSKEGVTRSGGQQRHQAVDEPGPAPPFLLEEITHYNHAAHIVLRPFHSCSISCFAVSTVSGGGSTPKGWIAKIISWKRVNEFGRPSVKTPTR